MKKISIVGAGFSGLTLALRLAQQGFQVEIYDRASKPGGLISTEKTSRGLAESAANSVIATNSMQALFSELKIEAQAPLATSKKRFIFRGHPRKWPLTFFETLGFLSRFLPRLILAKKSMRPRGHQTLQSWGEKILGKAATRFLLGPAMQGIYANEISGLSASLILGPLFSKPREKYKGLLSGKNGMQTLIDGLYLKLQELGVQFHFSQELDLKSSRHPVVLATSANAAAKILTDVDSRRSQILAKIPMSSLISATLFFAQAQMVYQGFGCLIPRGLNLKTLGILMNPYIFPDRDKSYNETWILGGLSETALLQLTDTQLLELITQERSQILNSQATVEEFRIYRWPQALPYYGTELEKSLQELKALPDSSAIYLHGNYLAGIGLSKILELSEKLAQQIGQDHG